MKFPATTNREPNVPGLDLDLGRARDIGVAIAEAAGRLLARRRGDVVTVRDKGADGDVVTDLDDDAERLIVDGLHAAYPAHRIIAEESGLAGGDDQSWTWLVDPLDGTNNVKLGLPVYVVGLALCHEGRPVVGIVHEPESGDTWSAISGLGAEGPGIGRLRDPGRAQIVSWTQGYAVGREDNTARALRLVLEGNTQRLLQLWAPLQAWAMLARGDIDGFVGYRPEAIDLPAGALIASEAGMHLRALDGGPFDHGIDEAGWHRDRSFVAGPPEMVDWLVTRVKAADRITQSLAELWSDGDLGASTMLPLNGDDRRPR